MKYDKKMNLIRIIIFSPILLAIAYDSAQWVYMKYLNYSFKQQEQALFHKVYGSDKHVEVYADGNVPINGSKREQELAKKFAEEKEKLYAEFTGKE